MIENSPQPISVEEAYKCSDIQISAEKIKILENKNILINMQNKILIQPEMQKININQVSTSKIG